jgi:excinuclease ABC subunit B
VVRAIDEVLTSVYERDYATPAPEALPSGPRSPLERAAEITRLEREMKAAAADLDFERAAALRDTLKALRTWDLGLAATPVGQ